MNWDEYFFRHVYLAASKSKDKMTKIGAVIVRDNAIISEGYNGICRGVNDNTDDGRNDRPTKYFFYEHAERNSIYHCAKHGISTLKAIIYTNGLPCSDCCRAIIQSGISKIIIHGQFPAMTHSTKWIESMQISYLMLKEANIPVESYCEKLGLETLIDGKIIKV